MYVFKKDTTFYGKKLNIYSVNQSVLMMVWKGYTKQTFFRMIDLRKNKIL